MKLNQLHDDQCSKILLEYVNKLKRIMEGPKVLTEGRKIITTVEIVDDDEPEVIKQHINPNPTDVPQNPPLPMLNVPPESKKEFVERAESVGDFNNPQWVNQLISGMKQAGIHGVNDINKDEIPVSRGEFKKLIGLLTGLLGPKND